MSKKPKKDLVASQIPYSVRLQIKKQTEIYAEREDAEITAMKIACVALNDVFGLGFERLSRFCLRYKKLSREFYADRETQEIHLHDRLREMGFGFDPKTNEFYAIENPDGSFSKPSEVEGKNEKV